MVVWKFKLSSKISGCPQSIELPIGSRFLCIQNQANEAVAYFLCDHSESKDKYEKIIIEASMTGQNVRGYYLGTCLFDSDNYVLHYFLIKNISKNERQFVMCDRNGNFITPNYFI